MSRILVIDDNVTVAETCASALSSVGYGVATAKDGRAAIALLQSEPADLILTDLDMPYGGVQAIGVLRKLHPKIPIIVMSGTGKAKLDMAETLGAHRTLAKPFTGQELIDAVAELLPGKPGGPGRPDLNVRRVAGDVNAKAARLTLPMVRNKTDGHAPR